MPQISQAASSSLVKVRCPGGMDCTGWSACISNDENSDSFFNTRVYFDDDVQDFRAVVEYPETNNEFPEYFLIAHGQGANQNIGVNFNFMATGRDVTAILAQGYNGPFCGDDVAADNDPQPNEQPRDENEPENNQPEPQDENMNNLEIRVECPEGYNCEGWKACVSWANGDFEPFSRNRVRDNLANMPYPDMNGAIVRAIIVVHGTAENESVGVANDFNLTGRGFPVVPAEGYNGPLCGEDEPEANLDEADNELIAELQRLRNRFFNCGAGPWGIACMYDVFQDLFELLRAYNQPVTLAHNPSQQDGAHPFERVYEFSKHPKCLTCHSYTMRADVMRNGGQVVEGESVQRRILELRAQPYHDLENEDLINPQSCVGCHGQWEVYGTRGPGIAPNVNDMWDWMAPAPHMNFFGDNSKEMCEKFVRNLANNGPDIAESIEHHLKEDGRVLWSIRQHPDAQANQDSERNAWIQAVDNWLEVLDGDEAGWCPQ